MSANQTHERTGKTIELVEAADFTLGKLQVRPSCREIAADGRTETIEPRVMQVVVALARRRGEVVSREQLIESCWGGRLVSEDALNRCMTKVRKLAAPGAFALETIPRVGYRLIAADPPVPDVLDTPAPPRETISTKEQPGGGVPVRRRRWVRWVAGAGVLLVVMVIGASIGFYRQMSRPYFAVLPFDVVSSDPRAAMLAAAIPAAIATQLRAQGYKLVPASVTAGYRGDRKSAAVADLNARYLVDGSVHVERDRLRIVARIDAAGRVSVWTQEIKVDADESASTPEHVAMMISELFNPGVRMLFDNPPHVTAAIMRNGSRMRAGDDLGAYLAARELWRKSPKTRIYAIHYALAVGAVLDLLPPQERMRALQEGRRAIAEIAKDPVTGAPMSTFATTPPVEWMEREVVLRKGLEQPFSDASGLRRLLATHLANAGRFAEALAVSEQALNINRSSATNITANAYVLDAMGQIAEAEAVISRAERWWPRLDYVVRMRFSTALARRDADAMHALLADAESGPVLDPPADAHPLPAIARALATGTAAEIERLEIECADPTKIARERARFCLHALVLLDRIDTFFALAPLYFPEQRGAIAEERDAHWLADPRVLSHVRVLFRHDASKLRADERFIPIVQRLGLVDYWRASGVWPDFCNREPASVCAKLQRTN